MQIGAMFPTTEIGNDPIAIKDYAQGVEELGFDYITTIEHVLQVDPKGNPEIFAPYTLEDSFHEPFVLHGFLAACTERVGLSTAIIVLPQRQTVLAAKQAAEVDGLSGGRLRLGIGIGWQDIEYVALNEDWTNRGKRCEEQVELMRALWCNKEVDFKGECHEVPESGFNPNSVQKPIPIWFGGMADAVADRVGRIGDGWIPAGTPEDLKPQMDIMYAAAEKAGRDPKSIGIESITGLSSAMTRPAVGTMDQAVGMSQLWMEAGATHYCFGSSMIGLDNDIDAHLKLAKEYKERMDAL